MNHRLLVRVRRAPFAAGCFVGAAVVCWVAWRTMRLPLGVAGGPMPGVAVPGVVVGVPPMSHAHEGWLAVRAFERLMDSLRRDSSGRAKYDSILFLHPGILDSAKTAEAFYFSHDH